MKPSSEHSPTGEGRRLAAPLPDKPPRGRTEGGVMRLEVGRGTISVLPRVEKSENLRAQPVEIEAAVGGAGPVSLQCRPCSPQCAGVWVWTEADLRRWLDSGLIPKRGSRMKLVPPPMEEALEFAKMSLIYRWLRQGQGLNSLRGRRKSFLTRAPKK